MCYSHGIPLPITLFLLTIGCALSNEIGEPMAHDEHPYEEGKTVDSFGIYNTDDILACKRFG
jgi:hypothetical protein